jgi:hypothetical protein
LRSLPASWRGQRCSLRRARSESEGLRLERMMGNLTAVANTIAVIEMQWIPEEF